MTPRSRTDHNACLWEPQEREIRLHSHPESTTSPTSPTSLTSPFGGFWYLQLSPEIMIGLGRRPESVASDAAAMRKLASAAAEVAGELERRAQAAAEQKEDTNG